MSDKVLCHTADGSIIYVYPHEIAAVRISAYAFMYRSALDPRIAQYYGIERRAIPLLLKQNGSQ